MGFVVDEMALWQVRFQHSEVPLQITIARYFIRYHYPRYVRQA
jgi:hypothetical protein